MYEVSIGAIVLAIIVIAAALSATRKYRAYLTGYWSAHPDFAKAANISEFQLFIAPPDPGTQISPGYLIIADTVGAPTTNQPIELTIEPSSITDTMGAFYSTFASQDEFEGLMDINYAPAKSGLAAASALPSKLRFSLSMQTGTLTLYSVTAATPGKVYACLVKDLVTSEVALRAYAAKPTP